MVALKAIAMGSDARSIERGPAASRAVMPTQASVETPAFPPRRRDAAGHAAHLSESAMAERASRSGAKPQPGASDTRILPGAESFTAGTASSRA